MSNSSLATVHYWTNNYSSRNGAKITSIIIHHMATVGGTAKSCYNAWKTRQGSAHYAISTTGQIGQLVDEKYRAWSAANAAADSKSVTIELANVTGSPNWKVSDQTIAACIDLCVDICKRNGIEQLKFTGDKSGTLLMHCYFAATACPGPYMKTKFAYIANAVNKKLAADPTPTPEPKPTPAKGTWNGHKPPFIVRVKYTDLYIRKGPGIAKYGRQTVDGSQFIKPGAYTITDIQTADGYTWGKLKSSTASSPRWIALDYTEFVRAVDPAPTPTPSSNLKRFFTAVKAQAEWSYKSTYKWQANPTVAKSKTRGTCVTFVACVLQRYGAIKPGEYIYHDKGKVYGAITKDMTIIYCHQKTPSQLKGTLTRGDIVMHNDTAAGHIEIYAGEMKDGKAKYWTGGCGSGHNTSMNYWNSRKILAIVRLKSIQ